MSRLLAILLAFILGLLTIGPVTAQEPTLELGRGFVLESVAPRAERRRRHERAARRRQCRRHLARDAGVAHRARIVRVQEQPLAAHGRRGRIEVERGDVVARRHAQLGEVVARAVVGDGDVPEAFSPRRGGGE